MITASQTRSVQRALAAEGCDPGPVDGKMGPRTTQAIKSYQQKENLPQTGVIDDSLLSTLKPAPAPAPQGNTTAKCPECKCPPVKGLGSLSAGYESGGVGSKAIGYDTTGGYSYGKYQIESAGGTMENFLENLKTTSPELSKKLEDAGGNAGAKAGTKAFKDAWKAAADDPGLTTAEHDYIAAKNYQPSVDKLNEGYGLDVNERSVALRDVVWSVSVQHGPGKKGEPTPVLKNALKDKDTSKMTDQEIIDAIYDERSKLGKNADGTTYPAYFKKSTPKVQKSVLSRFETERICALRALEAEDAAK